MKNAMLILTVFVLAAIVAKAEVPSQRDSLVSSALERGFDEDEAQAIGHFFSSPYMVQKLRNQLPTSIVAGQSAVRIRGVRYYTSYFTTNNQISCQMQTVYRLSITKWPSKALSSNVMTCTKLNSSDFL